MTPKSLFGLLVSLVHSRLLFSVLISDRVASFRTETRIGSILLGLKEYGIFSLSFATGTVLSHFFSGVAGTQEILGYSCAGYWGLITYYSCNPNTRL